MTPRRCRRRHLSTMRPLVTVCARQHPSGRLFLQLAMASSRTDADAQFFFRLAPSFVSVVCANGAFIIRLHFCSALALFLFLYGAALQTAHSLLLTRRRRSARPARFLSCQVTSAPVRNRVECRITMRQICRPNPSHVCGCVSASGCVSDIHFASRRNSFASKCGRSFSTSIAAFISFLISYSFLMPGWGGGLIVPS